MSMKKWLQLFGAMLAGSVVGHAFYDLWPWRLFWTYPLASVEGLAVLFMLFALFTIPALIVLWIRSENSAEKWWTEQSIQNSYNALHDKFAEENTKLGQRITNLDNDVWLKIADHSERLFKQEARRRGKDPVFKFKKPDTKISKV